MFRSCPEVAKLSVRWLIGVVLLIAMPAAASGNSEEIQLLEAGQQQRLDVLAYEIFEQPVPNLKYRYFRINSRDLFRRFGKPKVTKYELSPHRDPGPMAPQMIEHQVWLFPGMNLEISAYPPSANHKPEKIIINRIEIFGPTHRLKYGLNVGVPLSRFIERLGEPNVLTQGAASYFIDGWKRKGSPGYTGAEYQIDLKLDENQIVKRIIWEWGGC